MPEARPMKGIRELLDATSPWFLDEFWQNGLKSCTMDTDNTHVPAAMRLFRNCTDSCYL